MTETPERRRREKSLPDRVAEWVIRGVAALALFFLHQIYQDTKTTAHDVADLKLKVAVLEERTRSTPEGH